MATEHRTEQTVLHPTHIEFLELRVLGSRACTLRIVRTTEDTADVGIEVRIARQRETESCRHLLAQHVPRGVHVTAPHVRSVVLLTGITASRHDEDADRKSTRLNSSHQIISYAVFC